MEEFKKEIIRILSKKIDAHESLVTTPPNTEMGDFTYPCFELARELKKNPAEAAKQIADELQTSERIKEIKAIGPYINFFVNQKKYAELVFDDVLKLKNDYGRCLSGKGKKVMIEFSSPNTNKPLHLGHVRNILLGTSVSNIFDFCSHNTIRTSLVNDRGIHICKSMIAYKKWGEGKEPDKKSDHFVGDFYVLFSQKAKEDPELEKEAQELLRKWEEGDKETLALWKKMNAWVYKGFEETYDKLGTRFDSTNYESDHYKDGKDIVMDGFKRGVFKKHEEGYIYADFDEKIPDKVLVRSDGTSIYITQDIYLAKMRFEKNNIDKLIYVVGSEQNLHFQQVFALLKKLGYDFHDKAYHLSYGMVYLPEGKMKSREGTVIDADDIIEEMKNLAKEEVEKRYSEIGEREVKNRSNAIGMAALKFYMLKYDPVKDIHYDPKESISFEGETGPYVQYAYARISSILRKFEGKIEKDFEYSFEKPEERKIIKLVSEFPSVVCDASSHLKPSLVARYLLDLAQSFNEFYHACPVLKAEENEKKARLLLISSVRQVLKNGLALLGIECLEEM